MPPLAKTPSARSIGRISLYRRLLADLARQRVHHVFSHQLAERAGVTSAQLRRDLMPLGCLGSPARGYSVQDLGEAMDRLLDAERPMGAALVGVGNLGRALLAYFANRRPSISLRAAFDADPAKAGRMIGGTPCHPMTDLMDVVERERLAVGIITVPEEQAQGVADQLIRAGVRGLLNYAPVHLNAPSCVFVEDMDMLLSLEKVAFFAKQNESVPNHEMKGVAS